MKIVVGYHDTAEGRAAFERAAEIAEERGAEVHLVRVIEQPKNDEEGRDYETRRTREEGRILELARGLGHGNVTFHAHVPVAVSRPGPAILAVANQEHADLIVIGMRRRSRVGKLVLGSTAQEILLDSECEVLAVKAADDH